MEIPEIAEKIIDEGLAMMVVGSAVYMSTVQAAIPDWHIAAVGAVMAYYFQKKMAN